MCNWHTFKSWRAQRHKVICSKAEWVATEILEANKKPESQKERQAVYCKVNRAGRQAASRIENQTESQKESQAESSAESHAKSQAKHQTENQAEAKQRASKKTKRKIEWKPGGKQAET